MMSINIWLHPSKRPFFTEVVEALRYLLDNKGYNVIVSEGPDLSKMNIEIGHSASDPEYVASLNIPIDRLIILNYEQLFEGSGLARPEYIALLKKYSAWDYSTKNQQWLKERGIDAKIARFGYSPKIECVPLGNEKKYTVLFYGLLAERRLAIRDKLINEYKVPNVLFACAFGTERDLLISQSIIVLNIHHLHTFIFEWVRVSHLLANGAFVITEESVDDQDYTDIDIVRQPYDNICQTIVYYLANPEKIKEMAERGKKSILNMRIELPALK